MKEVPKDHPLRKLFHITAERAFSEELHWPDPEVFRYIGDLLIRFVHADDLYPLLGSEGKRIDSVAEMLPEGDLFLRARTVEREREVHRYIGDYTLFMVGIFPQYLKRISARIVHHADTLLDHVRVGKRSYRIVSKFDFGEFAAASPLYRKLSENFELCIVALDNVRSRLERERRPPFKPPRLLN